MSPESFVTVVSAAQVMLGFAKFLLRGEVIE